MFDIKAIREDPELFDGGWARRGFEPQSARILEIDARRRKLQTDLQGAQARRNELSKEIGKAKTAGGNADKQIAEVGELKSQIQTWEAEEREAAWALTGILEGLPNLPSDEAPDGAGESDNVTRREEGEKPEFDFEPREHFDLGEALGQMDFERAARISGARFVVLTGALARLERALGQFMLDIHTREFGYTEVSTPVLVRSETLYGTGQLPKFADDLFKMGDDHWLIPTAEVPLSNLDRETIIAEDELPHRFVALTQCFRAEAGAAGRDTRGMIRQHQFAKVELVSVTAPEDSDAELERLTGAAEEILKRLGLAYRVVELCAGDLSFSTRRTYDLEAWLPGQGRYREISSCSTCGDFQARRMQMRCRKKDEKETRFPHTLNGSGLAVGRTLVAVMENYQQADGSIRVPDALKPYMGGLETIDSDAP